MQLLRYSRLYIAKPFMIKKKNFLFVIAAAVLMVSCSTKKNTIFSRAYHNTTAHFNGYYNGKLKLKEGVDKLAEQHTDKYDRILSVFRYGDVQKAKSIFPEMDEVIKKSSLVIQRHSINIQGTEHCRWIDENWLLIGKAQFFKHDYFSATETFEYVSSSFPDDPSKFEALIWLAQTNIALTKFSSAEFTLDYLKSEPKFPKALRGELEAVLADFYLQLRDYPKAAEHLVKAVPHTKNRDSKIRYMFILAQIYQHENQNKNAFRFYSDVIHKNPVYEMAFNARINRARCFDSDDKSGKEVKRELLRMLKDEKNKDYLDQIYYALGGLSLNEKDTVKALENLRMSVDHSKGNDNQKAIAYLDMGKIYFSKHNYKAARTYYDSTMVFLSTDHPDYDLILNRRNSLTKLMKNLNTIALEDSLQHLSTLSEEALDDTLEQIALKKYAEEEFKKLQEKLKKEQQQQQSKQFAPSGTERENPFGTQSASGGWYFYNPQTVSFGFNEFIKKWGNRKSEDNWRRVNKESVVVAQQESEGEEESVGIDKKDSVPDPDAKTKKVAALKKKFLEKIPLTEKMRDASNRKIIDAYYSNGLIYKESLGDMYASAESFETMLKRFPDNKYTLQSYYNLYRIYLAVDDSAKRDYYKNILLNQYPESEYAALIRNPDKSSVRLLSDSALNHYYESTYNKYMNAEYAEVIRRKQISDSLFPANVLMPKFDYLKTLSIGRTNTIPIFASSLKDIIKNYPTDPVKNQAQEILDYINGVQKDSIKQQSPAQADSNAFTFVPDTVHYTVITFLQKDVNSESLKVKLSDYNTMYYSLLQLKIGVQQLGKDRQMITIQEFADKPTGQDYTVALKEDENIFGSFTPGSFELFTISAGNYIKLLKEKDIEKYLAFYDQNYF